MRVVHILATNLLSTSVGGSGTYVREYFKNRSDHVNTVLVGATQDQNVPLGVWREEKIGERTFDYLPIMHVGGKDYTYHGGVPKNAVFMKQLWKYKKQILEGADCLHIHRSELAVPFAFPRAQKPYALTIHGVGSQIEIAEEHRFFSKKSFRFFYFMFENHVIRQAGNVILVSHEGRDYYVNKFPALQEKFIHIPTSVDTAHFIPTEKTSPRKALGLPANAKALVFVGRFHEQKGLDLLIDSFALLKETEPDAHLILVGDGVLKHSLQDQIDRLNVKDVHFQGIVGHDRLPQILNAADIFVMASLWEGMPIAVLEAMACGLPVVSTDIGQVGNLVKDGETGYLVKERDPKLFKEQLIKGLKHTKKMVKNCRAVGEAYSSEHLARKLEEVYGNISEKS